MKRIATIALVAAVALASCKGNFQKAGEGIEYKIVGGGSGEKIKYGQFLQFHVTQIYNDGKKDSVLKDTRSSASAITPVDSVAMNKTYYSILSQLRKGDSLVMRISTDTIIKQSAQNPMGQLPAFIKPKGFMYTTIKVINILKTKDEADSVFKKEMEVAQEKMKAEAEEMAKKDDKTLQDYFAKNNIKTVKAPGGTYVEILQPGTGANIDTTVLVATNYTGKVMGGTKAFDSNTDPAFNHVEPFNVNMTNDPSLGQGVMPGWKNGLTMLNKGAKARFYIPSGQAYGPQGAGQDIAPNSNLVFDIEVLDVYNKQQGLAIVEKQMKAMQEKQKQMMDSISRVHKAAADTAKK